MPNFFAGNPFAPDPELKIWFDGELLPVADARVSVFDHGLLYGDGIFEGIRSYNGRIFERHAHLRRFFDSAKALQLKLEFDYDAVDKALTDALEGNDLLHENKDSYIRMVATRGVGALGISPRRCGNTHLFIIAAQLSMYPPEMYEKGMPVIISSVTRNHSNAMPPRIKSLNYLNNILGKIEAHEANVGEAIMLNHMGFVAEATGDNLFIVRGGQIQTPPTSAGILEGITRNTIIRLARENGFEVVEKDLVRTDLYCADEFFLTGTGAQVIPVTSIDKRIVADGKPGPITKQLIKIYDDYVRQPHPEDRRTEARLVGAAT